MIKSKIVESVGLITLARPWVDNAISTEMGARLGELLQYWRHEQSLKILVVTGEGESFCSGADEEELHTLGKHERSHAFRQMMDVLYQLHTFPKPTVAALNGTAVEGGCELATACDFRIAHASVKLGLIQIQRGLTTGWGGADRLLDLIPRTKAMELLYMGNKIDSTTAHQWGLVDKIFPQEKFIDHVLKWCGRMTRHPVAALEAYKQTVLDRENHTLTHREQLNREVDRCLALWDSLDNGATVSQLFQRTKKKNVNRFK